MKNITYNGNQIWKRYKKKMNIRCTLLTMIFLSAVFFTIPAHADKVTNNIIDYDAVWTEDMSPYIIKGKIKIAHDVTLTIDPNVIIQFDVSDPNSGLEVNGTLNAQGKDHKPILFTITDTEDEDHYWGCIKFTEDSTAWDGSSGCILSHCIIEYGGNGLEGAQIICDSASPLITNNIIRYSKANGITTNEGMLNIIGNRIHDTVCGIKLIIPEGGLVENNYLIDNELGIYIESGDGDVTIRNNTIRNNTVKSSSLEEYGGCLGINLFSHNRPSLFTWEQIPGPYDNLIDPNKINEVNPTFIAPEDILAELLTFQLTVTDKGGLQSVDRVTIKLTPENQPPIAFAKTDPNKAYYYEGDEVMLDGSGSSDADDGIITYAWEQTSDPNDKVILSNADSEQCTFIAPASVGPEGEKIVFQLTVTDRSGLQAKDTVIIEVKEKKVLVAEAGLWQTVDEGDPVTLDGSGSSDLNIITSWLWQRIEGQPVDYSDTNSLQASFTAPEVEEAGECLSFQLTIMDDDGNESSDTVFINVVDTDSNSPNMPPDPNTFIISGVDEADEDDSVTLSGATTDPDGDTITYLWEQISGSEVVSPSSNTDPNYSFTTPDVIEDEELIFRLTVTDEHGLKVSDTKSVKVLWINDLPEADAGLDQTVEENYMVLLDGSGSEDTDDGIASYLWEQTSGPQVILSSPSTAKPVFPAPIMWSKKTLAFRLTVTDRNGDKDDDSVFITVTPQNDPPIANAGPDQKVVEGELVTLDGSASYDPDPNENIVSYLWKELDEPEAVTLSNSTGVRPQFEAPPLDQDGNSPHYQSHTFLLTVEDKYGLKSSDSVIINITDDPNNQMPRAEAGPDQTATAGSEVTLDGSGSFDPDITSTLLISNNHFINNDDEGIGNAIAISENQSSSCNLSIIGNNLEYLNGKFMVYLHNWKDEDPNDVNITDNWWGTPSGTASVDEVSSLIYDGDQNEYLPRVNYSSLKDAKIDNAKSDLDYPPMADAGEDQTVEPDDKVTLDGSNTYDPDGIMSYVWSQTEGQTVNLHDAETIAATFIAPVPEEPEEDEEEKGVLKFKITVTDENGFYDTDEIEVKIEDPEEEKARRKSSGCFISTIGHLTKTDKKVSKRE